MSEEIKTPCKEWYLINKNVTAYALNETHILYVLKTEDGIELRVMENNNKLHKPRILFVKSFTDKQLGYF